MNKTQSNRRSEGVIMEETIRNIIERNIEKEFVFDAHTIIEYLIQNYSDIYLSSFNDHTTAHYHSRISQTIAKFEGTLINRVGKCWSKNIRDNFTECVCWKRI